MKPLIAIAVLLGSVVVAQPSAAREWRGCKASIAILADGRRSTLWEFEGRGSCRNRAHANDCRRAARDAIANCVRGAWRDRWDRKLPGECATGNESASDRPFVKGIANTGFGRGRGSRGDQDFKWAVEHAACCKLNPNAGNIRVIVGADTQGDSGCRSPSKIQEDAFDLTLERNYQVDCRRVREQGFCAVRTGGLPALFGAPDIGLDEQFPGLEDRLGFASSPSASMVCQSDSSTMPSALTSSPFERSVDLGHPEVLLLRVSPAKRAIPPRASPAGSP